MRARFKPHPGAHEQLLRMPATQSVIDGLSGSVASAAGSGYRASQMQGASRYRAIVYAETFRARRDNGRNNSLLKALGSVGI